MDKRFWGFLAVVAVVFGVLFFFTSNHKAAAPSHGKATVSNHIEGKGTTGVLLTEYGDYQCPACGEYYPLVKEVQQQYNDQIKFQFRNFPLYQIHPNAIAGARAAEAAGLQGKYWQMHDKLYEENQTYYSAENSGKTYNTWINASNPLDYFKQYAGSLGLNVSQYVTDYQSSYVNDVVQADLAEGNKLNVNQTPTFFIDGKKISNPNSVDAFDKVIDNAIKQKTGSAPQKSNATANTGSSSGQ